MGIIWVTVAVALVGFCFWKNTLLTLPLLLIAGILLGMWRGGIVQVSLTPYKNLLGHTVLIEGRVAEDLERSKQQGVALRIDTQTIDNHPLLGTVWATISHGSDIRRGDIVTVKGKLAEGFGSFSGSMYRAEVTNVRRSSDIALEVRDWFSRQAQMVIAQPEAGLGLGIMHCYLVLWPQVPPTCVIAICCCDNSFY
jgi:hypothetical protein